MLSFNEFAAQWSALHGGAQTTGIVGGWLRISFALAKILGALRISPNALTLLGLLSAGATVLSGRHWSAGIFLLFSLMCDGVDGSVAIIQNRASSWGATLDAVADRISEALWAVTFYRLGVPLSWVLALASLAAFQEYSRAKLISDGVKEIGLVTPAERPVRAIFLFIAIIAWNIHATRDGVIHIAQALTALQGISFAMLLKFAYLRLR